MPVFPTVAEALTLGSGKLAVDGVFLIAEQGDYPLNNKGQKLYPRYRLYKEIVDVFRSSGRAVPVFNDKHFSVDWNEAKWMFDQSRELRFPLLAGSSMQLTWRQPRLESSWVRLFRTRCLSVQGEKKSMGSITSKVSRPWWNGAGEARRASPRCSAWKARRSGGGQIQSLGEQSSESRGFPCRGPETRFDAGQRSPTDRVSPR